MSEPENTQKPQQKTLDLDAPPRHTKAWVRLVHHLAAELEHTRVQTPEFANWWRQFVDPVVELWSFEQLPADARANQDATGEMDETRDRFVTSLGKLVEILEAHAPGVVRVCGEYIGQYLIFLALRCAEAEDRDRFPPPARAARLLPVDLRQVMSGQSRTDWAGELAALLNSYGRGAGRPKKPKGMAPATRRQAIDKDLAERARKLKELGKTDVQIAKALFPATNLTNRRAVDAARQKAHRAALRGQKNHKGSAPAS